MRVFLRTWFAFLALGLLLIFSVNILIMGFDGLHLISLTVLVFAGLFGWLAWHGRVFLRDPRDQEHAAPEPDLEADPLREIAEEQRRIHGVPDHAAQRRTRGKVENWAGLIGTLLLALPVTIVVAVCLYILAINYPKEPPYEPKLVPPPVTEQDRLGYREFLRWTIDPADRIDVNAIYGDITHPGPGISHPAPRIGRLHDLRKYRESPIKPLTPVEDIDPADLQALTEFWMFLAENPIAPPPVPTDRILSAANISAAGKVESRIIEHLFASGNTKAGDERLRIFLSAFTNDGWQQSGLANYATAFTLLEHDAMRCALEARLTAEAGSSLQEIVTVVQKIAEDRPEIPRKAMSRRNIKLAAELEKLADEHPRHLLGFSVFTYNYMNAQPGWEERALGVDQCRYLGLRVATDYERTKRLGESFFAAYREQLERPWTPEKAKRRQKLAQQLEESRLEEPRFAFLQKNGWGRKILFTPMNTCGDLVDREYLVQAQLELYLAALQILSNQAMPEEIPLDPVSGQPLVIQPDPNNPDTHLLITVPEDSPLRDWVDQLSTINYPLSTIEEDLQLTIPRPQSLLLKGEGKSG